MISKNITFIGAGNMCKAHVSGFLESGICTCENIKVVGRDPEKLMDFKKIGIYPAKDIHEAAEFADIIFISVKPKDCEAVCLELAKENLADKTVVSIAAGITMAFYEKMLGKTVAVCRAMPNTPILVGMGATFLCRNKNVPDKDFDLIYEMFRALGFVCKGNEEQINAVIGASGSGPAYVYLMIKAMCDWAIAHGISEGDAKKLVCATFSGAAAMVENATVPITDLIRTVSCPGGTTLKALEVFEKENFERIVSDAMDACEKRAAELTK